MVPRIRCCGLALVCAVLALQGCGGGGDRCADGTLSCRCLPDDACHEGTCQDGRCVAPACTPGAPGCDCLADGSCTTGTCTDGLCVAASCVQGTIGCGCLPDGTCTEGGCHEGRCNASLPTVAQCFTPCRSPLPGAGGELVTCPADGLMPTCLGGQVCFRGSCVAPGEEPPGCVAETDCPDFQTCTLGRCYSTCNVDSECSGATRCHRHVCRTPCTGGAPACPAGTGCSTVDGTTGFCLPLREATGAPQTEVIGSYTVSVASLAFTSSHVRETLTITNHTPVPVEFKIKKLDHTEYRATGTTHVTENPLPWLQLGEGTTTTVPEITLSVEGDGGRRQFTVAGAGSSELTRWTGHLEVQSDTLGNRAIGLDYVSLPDGQWSGRVFHFANFGDRGLAAWTANKDDANALSLVGNAFIRRWGAFRKGAITWDEMQAVITATLTESWRWPSVKGVCTGAEACYLYSNADGFSPYSESLAAYPIPTAATELPISVNLQVADPANPSALVGKIVSAGTLQHTGDPAITVQVAGDPTACSGRVLTACVAPLAALDATILVGGRYATTAADRTCAAAARDTENTATFTQAAIPWLVPGFTAGTEVDAATGLRYRYECRDRLLPLGNDGQHYADNASFAQSNPIPDGLTRRRVLELVDGAFVNQKDLLIVFRERFAESFLGATDTEGFSAYGVMMLSRAPAELGADDFVGHTLTDTRTPPTSVLSTSCDPAVVEQVLGAGVTPDATNATALARGLVTGQATSGVPVVLPAAGELPHYLCHDSGLFDGGPRDDGTAAAVKQPCPVGSHVTYFTAHLAQLDIAGMPCQQDGTCGETLELWQANQSFQLRLNPTWSCVDPDKMYCSTNRLDLRAEKQFFAQTPSAPVFLSLLATIDEAFRYKTRFRSRLTGSTVGFAPQTCVPNSNAVPYCYDPAAIEEARARIDCLLDLYFHRGAWLDSATKALLRTFLTSSFAYSQDSTTIPPTVYDGFERLNAELLIMLGDDAYTAAFASRFDLAGQNLLSFEGSKFEPNGINLSGGAGYEMYELYQATQYYQLVLDRFYANGPYVWQSVAGAPGDNVITQGTVVAYFDKLARASTQKARAMSAIAQRYHGFNRPELARRVIERAYAAAYLESIIIGRMMLRVIDVASPADRDQIVQRAELAALGYRAALLEMRDAHRSITDDTTHFGFAPDYIPFPALEEGDVNAFQKSLAQAQASVATAAGKEVLALDNNRTYETDAAKFQAELVNIRNNYENQLAELCGTFVADDGQVYPAITSYAALGANTRLVGDPCGLVGNGKISAAKGQFDVLGLELEEVRQGFRDVEQAVTIETTRAAELCDEYLEEANYQYQRADRLMTLESDLRELQSAKEALEKAAALASDVARTQKCLVGAMGTNCPQATAASIALTVINVGLLASTVPVRLEISDQEDAIKEFNRDTAKWVTNHQCDYALVESNAKVATIKLRLSTLKLQALKAVYRVQLAAAELVKLRNEVTRLLAQRDEMQQQTINVEAARNDPNVRIYRNDSVLTADRTFQAALKDAYQATKVFEYFTSQCYAHADDLYLVRMVTHGDYSLEAYLEGLAGAYRAFQQQYGTPDLRVEVLSLRDDVLDIPRVDTSGRALTQDERVDALRTALKDPARIDAQGYLNIPFSTSLERLSPLTRNHKIHHVEAEILGTDVGDPLGRLYVAQVGTGMVATVDGDRSYYRLPARTAVVNPSYNGVRAFAAEVYQNFHLRDRPLVNTHWKLIINQKDEAVNKDLNLQSVTDVKLYVYYTDFTST